MEVVIRYNDETGELQYSVAPVSDYDNWIDSFKDMGECYHFIEKNDFYIQKFINEVTG